MESPEDSNPGTLSWWRWRLRRAPQRQGHAPFIELVVDDSEEQAGEPLRLVLDSFDLRLEVRHETDLQLLRRVVEALC